VQLPQKKLYIVYNEHMENIDKNIAIYNLHKDAFEADHLGDWVLIFDEKVDGFYESFEVAAKNAVEKFGAGPYLIRRVGSDNITLPTSVMYNL
jgi:hypothetical protein